MCDNTINKEFSKFANKPPSDLGVIDYGDGSFSVSQTETVVKPDVTVPCIAVGPSDEELDIIRFEGEGGFVRE